jgi:hypothetical protein
MRLPGCDEGARKPQLRRHLGGHLIGDLAGFVGDGLTARMHVDDHAGYRAQYVLTDVNVSACLGTAQHNPRRSAVDVPEVHVVF